MQKNPIEYVDIPDDWGDLENIEEYKSSIENFKLAKQLGLQIVIGRAPTLQERKEQILEKIQEKREKQSAHNVGVAPAGHARKEQWWAANAQRYFQKELEKELEDISDILTLAQMLEDEGIEINPFRGTKKDLRLAKILDLAGLLRNNAGLAAMAKYLVESAHNTMNNVSTELSLDVLRTINLALKEIMLSGTILDATDRVASCFYMQQLGWAVAISGYARSSKVQVLNSPTVTAHKMMLSKNETDAEKIDSGVDSVWDDVSDTLYFLIPCWKAVRTIDTEKKALLDLLTEAKVSYDWSTRAKRNQLAAPSSSSEMRVLFARITEIPRVRDYGQTEVEQQELQSKDTSKAARKEQLRLIAVALENSVEFREKIALAQEILTCALASILFLASTELELATLNESDVSTLRRRSISNAYENDFMALLSNKRVPYKVSNLPEIPADRLKEIEDLTFNFAFTGTFRYSVDESKWIEGVRSFLPAARSQMGTEVVNFSYLLLYELMELNSERKQWHTGTETVLNYFSSEDNRESAKVLARSKLVRRTVTAPVNRNSGVAYESNRGSTVTNSIFNSKESFHPKLVERLDFYSAIQSVANSVEIAELGYRSELSSSRIPGILRDILHLTLGYRTRSYDTRTHVSERSNYQLLSMLGLDTIDAKETEKFEFGSLLGATREHRQYFVGMLARVAAGDPTYCAFAALSIAVSATVGEKLATNLDLLVNLLARIDVEENLPAANTSVDNKPFMGSFFASLLLSDRRRQDTLTAHIRYAKDRSIITPGSLRLAAFEIAEAYTERFLIRSIASLSVRNAVVCLGGAVLKVTDEIRVAGNGEKYNNIQGIPAVLNLVEKLSPNPRDLNTRHELQDSVYYQVAESIKFLDRIEKFDQARIGLASILPDAMSLSRVAYSDLLENTGVSEGDWIELQELSNTRSLGLSKKYFSALVRKSKDIFMNVFTLQLACLEQYEDYAEKDIKKTAKKNRLKALEAIVDSSIAGVLWRWEDSSYSDSDQNILSDALRTLDEQARKIQGKLTSGSSVWTAADTRINTYGLQKILGSSNIDTVLVKKALFSYYPAKKGQIEAYVLITDLCMSESWTEESTKTIVSMIVDGGRYAYVTNIPTLIYPYLERNGWRKATEAELDIYTFSDKGEAIDPATQRQLKRVRILPSREQNWSLILKEDAGRKREGNITKVEYDKQPEGRIGPEDEETAEKSTPKFITDKFKLQSCTFGSETYMHTSIVKFHVRSFYLAVLDTKEIFGISSDDSVGSSFSSSPTNLALSVNFGGAGIRRAAAHFSSDGLLMAFTKIGTSAFVHEFTHSIDFRLADLHKAAVRAVYRDAINREIQIQPKEIFVEWYPPRAKRARKLSDAISGYPLAIHDFTENPALLLLPPVLSTEVLKSELDTDNSVGGQSEQSKVFLDMNILSMDFYGHSTELEIAAACLTLSVELTYALDKWLANTIWSSKAARYNGPAYLSSDPAQSIGDADKSRLSLMMLSSMLIDEQYWPLPWELLARAIEAYSSDWLDARGRKNTYLVDRNSTLVAYGVRRPLRQGDKPSLLMPYPQDEFEVSAMVEGKMETYRDRPMQRIVSNENIDRILDLYSRWENICFGKKDPNEVMRKPASRSHVLVGTRDATSDDLAEKYDNTLKALSYSGNIATFVAERRQDIL